MKWLTYAMSACIIGATAYLAIAGVAGQLRPVDPVMQEKDIAQKPAQVPKPTTPDRRS